MAIILLVMEQFQKGIFILTKFTFLKVLKQELRRIRWAVLIIFGKSNSKKQESLGKEKNFAYSENGCNRKLGSKHFTNENK